MTLLKKIIHKLHCLGQYGQFGLSLSNLMEGIKGFDNDDFEDALIKLFKRRFIIMNSSQGWPSFSLNPNMDNEIDEFLQDEE